MLPSEKAWALWPLRTNAFFPHPLEYGETIQNVSSTTLSLQCSVSGSDSILHAKQSKGQEGKLLKRTGRCCPARQCSQAWHQAKLRNALRQQQHFPHCTTFSHSRKMTLALPHLCPVHRAQSLVTGKDGLSYQAVASSLWRCITFIAHWAVCVAVECAGTHFLNEFSLGSPHIQKHPSQ